MSITVTFRNTDLCDLYLSVFDNNTQNRDALLSGVRLNQSASAFASASEDSDGNYAITWQVVRTDDASETASRDVQDDRSGAHIDVTRQFG